ncbi:MAG: VOC family protein [Terracidiphilus sp.]
MATPRRTILQGALAVGFARIGSRAGLGVEFMVGQGETKAMEQRISIVTLGVRELAISRRFYVDGLGWKPVFENKEIVFFQAGGMIFALFLRDELAKDFAGDAATFGRAAVALAHNVRTKDEVDPLMKRASNAGATILKPAREASWGGYSGYFADPDGFAWEVAWNPAWRIAPNGSIEFH